MSLEDLREQNKEKVIAAALESFVGKGIENTKISEIAKRAGITERSIYRYFETKAELVLASALLFWDKIVQQSQKAYERSEKEHLSGQQQIGMVLRAYANQYFVDPKTLVFIQDAEIYLHRSKMSQLIRNKPPVAFECGQAPLCKAILKGLEDGTVKNRDHAERLYYNAYDGLLGLMQKMATSAPDAPSMRIDAHRRLEDYCEMLEKAFCE